MYYTACLLLTIQWQLLCQASAIVSLVYKWEGMLKIVWGGCTEATGKTAGRILCCPSRFENSLSARLITCMRQVWCYTHTS